MCPFEMAHTVPYGGVLISNGIPVHTFQNTWISVGTGSKRCVATNITGRCFASAFRSTVNGETDRLTAPLTARCNMLYGANLRRSTRI